MAARPEQSLPRQNESWGELKAAYRLLSHGSVTPEAIGRPHQRRTRQLCQQATQAWDGSVVRDESVVLCVQDETDLKSARVPGNRWVLHTTLAVVPRGEGDGEMGGKMGGVLGVLQQRCFGKVKPPRGEKRKQRVRRFRESDVWVEAASEVGRPPPGVRFVHVCDREGDDLRLMHACRAAGSDFVIRARHDRRVARGDGRVARGDGRVDQSMAKLWGEMKRVAVTDEIEVEIGTQRPGEGRTARRGRTARLEVRFARMTLSRPLNHQDGREGLEVSVVYLSEAKPSLSEAKPSAECKAVDWMLLSSLEVTTPREALKVVEYYRSRWVIEEWHRALKQGCRLEASQLNESGDLMRLAAVLSVVAVRLMRLRDMATMPREASAVPNDGSAGDRRQPEQDRRRLETSRLWLEREVPEEMRRVVASLRRTALEELTPQMFMDTLARRGGWLGRKHDPRPGWQALWTGWREIWLMAEALRLTQPPTCG